MHTRFLVVGSGYAGMLAAIRLARRAGPGRVTMVSPDLLLVERVRLHEAVAAGRDVTHDVARWADRLGIGLVRGHVVELSAGRARLEDGRSLAFEQAVVATGSRIVRNTPGAEHALALEPAMVPEIRARLEKAAHVVVMGGGLSGVELAAELAEAAPHRRVTLVSRSITPALTPRAREHVQRVLTDLGVTVLRAAIEAVEPRAVNTSEGRRAADLVIDTTGFRGAAPASVPGARDASGRVITDAALRTSDGLILAGDLARPAGEPIITGCQSAMPMGAHAADVAWALAHGRTPPAFSFVPNGYCVSLGRREGVIDAMGIVLRGRVAAWIKEQIVRYTVRSMDWQARGWAYRWRPASPRSRPLEIGPGQVA